jgi:ketosteroid isomerase-like protein
MAQKADIAFREKPFGETWMIDYFHMVDRLDAAEFVTWYAEDAVFCSGNNSPVSGKAAIIAALTPFYALIRSMRHEMTGCWTYSDSGVFEAIAHFETRDGRRLSLPAITTLRIKDNRVRRLLFVMDAAPIFHPTPGASQ